MGQLAAELLEGTLELLMRYPTLVSSVAALILSLAMPITSAAQSRSRGSSDNGGGERAVTRTAPSPPPASAPAPAAAPAPAPSRSGVSSGESGERAVRRAAPRPVESTASGSAAGAQNQASRPRSGPPSVERAVPRGSVPGRPVTIVRPQVRYYPGYSPWAWGGVGFGSYYGGFGFYSPYYYGAYPGWYGAYGYGYGAYGAYGYPSYGYPAAYSVVDGDLRLKVKPRDAQVFVDGYYVGIVDDFDGTFQRLHLPTGTHRIEVRAPGFETLSLDVQIRFDETTKYEGNLRANN
jgi:hypothetical protein